MVHLEYFLQFSKYIEKVWGKLLEPKFSYFVLKIPTNFPSRTIIKIEFLFVFDKQTTPYIIIRIICICISPISPESSLWSRNGGVVVPGHRCTHNSLANLNGTDYQYNQTSRGWIFRQDVCVHKGELLWSQWRQQQLLFAWYKYHFT